MTEKTKPNAPEEHDGPADRGNSADADTDTTAAAAEDAVAAPSRPESRPKQPLITAIEIENFKGIGAPVRIDLRPITLLFGRNSAGKSTILQALCYAHEILSHRNVDTHKTELGGDQIDLGGFRQFVHGHDLDRVFRIRFELNLKDWRVPAPLMSAIQGALNTGDPDSDEAHRQWFDQHSPAKTTRTGWVAFTAAWDRSRGTPALTSYEVGVNGRLVGRIETDDYGDVKLAFNWVHPLFEPLGGGQPAPAYPVVRRVGETADPDDEEWQLLRAVVDGGLQTLAPDWDRILDLDVDSQDMELLEDAIGSPHYLTIFEALVSSVLVGIGHTLRDELANLRYLGPVRELRPHTAVGPSPHEQGSWSDGEAAWNLLLRHNPHPAASPGSDLLKSVNEWLTHADRLDTGYKLRRQSTIELAADAPWVGLIRLHEHYLAECRDENGVVDVDRWVLKEAAALATLYGRDLDDLAARIRSGRNYDSGTTSPNDADQDAPADEHIETSHKYYQVLVGLVTSISKLERGDPPAVKALVRAIAEAREQSKIEIVTAESELPVRTSDIGVGVSQILPVVTAALDTKRPGITAIEQPELHVHPKIQVELGDLFIAAIAPYPGALGSIGNPERHAGIFLIETHSEHLILRLLRRIEETSGGELPEGKPALKPDQVSVVFLEQTDGEVRATRLRIDETGEFVDRWPQGFFEERSKELFY